MRFEVAKEKLMMQIVWWVPRWLVKWCAVRVFSHATTGKWSTQNALELDFPTALKRWNNEI